jgi:hypothetical protein
VGGQQEVLRGGGGRPLVYTVPDDAYPGKTFESA